MDYDESLKKRVLPRIDLREEAFRRFENTIANACKGSFVVKPRVEFGISPRTFLIRFTDAKRGYKLYGYYSDLIPANYELDRIKTVELDNDEVWIMNKFEDQQRARRMVKKSAWKEEGKWKANQKEQPGSVLEFQTIDEARETITKLANREVNGITTLVVVKESPEQEMKEVDLKWEELEGGWWRVI